MSKFIYCQRKEEGQDKCKKQCDHCKEYYAPLEMKHTMTYTDLAQILRANHFYPKLEETIFMEGKQVTGLILDCYSVIRMTDRVARLKEVLRENGVEGFKVDGMPNSMHIAITKGKV